MASSQGGGLAPPNSSASPSRCIGSDCDNSVLGPQRSPSAADRRLVVSTVPRSRTPILVRNVVRCSFCSKLILRRELVTHETEGCELRPVSCPHAECTFVARGRAMLASHIAAGCPWQPATCPHGCGSQGLTRSSLARHEATHHHHDDDDVAAAEDDGRLVIWCPVPGCTKTIAGEPLRLKDLASHIGSRTFLDEHRLPLSRDDDAPDEELPAEDDCDIGRCDLAERRSTMTPGESAIVVKGLICQLSRLQRTLLLLRADGTRSAEVSCQGAPQASALAAVSPSWPRRHYPPEDGSMLISDLSSSVQQVRSCLLVERASASDKPFEARTTMLRHHRDQLDEWRHRVEAFRQYGGTIALSTMGEPATSVEARRNYDARNAEIERLFFLLKCSVYDAIRTDTAAAIGAPSKPPVPPSVSS